MNAWTKDELDSIANAGELRVAGVRSDGTLRSLVIIWHVRVGDDIFIRSVNGPDAAWFRGTQVRGEGRVVSGGVTKDVTFVRVADRDADIDAAYRKKYGSGSAVRAITSELAAGTTLRVDPR
jgi:hypothetical protein